MDRRGSADGYHWGRAGEEVARAGRMGSGGGIRCGRLDDGREPLCNTVWSKQTNADFVGSSGGCISRYGWKERGRHGFLPTEALLHSLVARPRLRHRPWQAASPALSGCGSLQSTDAHEIAGTSGGYAPFWSPDGRDIGFFADGKLKRVGTVGGPVQVICDAEDGRGGSWSNFGTIIFAPTRTSPIFRVPAEGGIPTPVTRGTLATNIGGFVSHRW